MQEKQENKVTKIECITNCMYVMRFALRQSPGYYIFYMFALSILAVTESVVTVLFYKLSIECVKRQGSLDEVLITICLLGGILAIDIVCVVLLNRYHEIKSNEIAGKVQREIIKKAASIDIMYYDNPDFYNELVCSAEKGKEQIVTCVNVVAKILSQIMSIVSVVGVIMTMDRIAALLPVVAFFVNLITLKVINKIKYGLWMKIAPVSRKKYYSRRVFYEPEYAKEIRLTDIGESIFKQINEATEEEREIVQKNGIKLTIVSLLNYVLSWTLCVYYLPPFYFIYSTMVSKKNSISEMSSLYNANTTNSYILDNMVWRIIDLEQIGLYGHSFKKFMEYNEKIETRGVKKVDFETSKEIRFENVSFSYDGKKRVLNKINMTLQPGQKIAIVGHNGAGKSTFVKLLLNLYEPTEGKIYYDSTDIRDISVKEYRKAFSVIPQDFQIFAGDIAENVAMDSESDYNIDSIYEALRKAKIMGKVAQLKDGIHTQLTREYSEQGVLLSGGQNQKIALSRFFYRNSPNVVFDEPSSALDPIAEFEMNESVLTQANKKTVIFISHRLSTVKLCDYIYLFEKGQIIEEGSHEDLIKKNGKYAEMYRKQAIYYVKDMKNLV